MPPSQILSNQPTQTACLKQAKRWSQKYFIVLLLGCFVTWNQMIFSVLVWCYQFDKNVRKAKIILNFSPLSSFVADFPPVFFYLCHGTIENSSTDELSRPTKRSFCVRLLDKFHLPPISNLQLCQFTLETFEDANTVELKFVFGYSRLLRLSRGFLLEFKLKQNDID